MHTSIAHTGPRCHSSRRSAPTSSFQMTRLGTWAVSALIVATVCVSMLSFVVRPEAPAPAAWTTVSVSAYTSLWDLARSHRIDGLDTAATVDLIRIENELVSSTLHEGQVVLVPAGAVEVTALAQR